MAPDALAPPTRVRVRPWLLATGIAALVVWLVALEVESRHLGSAGPNELFFRELLFGPKRGRVIWASFAMALVALTPRQRWRAVGIAVAVDLAFFLGRLPFHTRLTFGNGALWTTFGIGAWALWRWQGKPRTDALIGVGVGLALILGTKISDAWLLITARTRPDVLDQYVQTADHVFANPSWWVGRALESSGWIGQHLIQTVYIELPVAAMLLAIWQVRHGWPRHSFVRTFLAIGIIGPAFYLLFPVVGPIYAYGHLGGPFALADVWPARAPFDLHPAAFRFDAVTPRNCMPSLHTAWVVAIFVHTRRTARPVRWLGAFWLVGTLIATLGFGWHYGVDLVVGAVFSLTIEAALRDPERGWDRPRVVQVVGGTVVFAAMLASYRWLSVPMARHAALSAVLLLGGLGAVIGGFYRQFFGRAVPAAASSTAPPESSTAPVTA